MPRGLEFSRVKGRRRQRRRRLCAITAALCFAAVCCGSRLAACAVRLPAWADAALAERAAPGYRARLADLQAENRSLRTALAASLLLRQENAALRSLVGSELAAPEPAYLPCTVTALEPGGGFTVDRALAPGTPLVDARGRLLGCAATRGARSSRAARLGGAGCRAVCQVNGAVGTACLRDGALWLTGLPRDCKAGPGDAVVTLAGESCPAGLWVGRLKAAPTLAPDCLTALAPLEDCAGLPAGACFAAQARQ